MTVGGSDDWESAQTGPWLVALALSCAVHGAVVWEGRSFVSTERTWVRAVMPVELVSPSPEPPHAAPRRPTRRLPGQCQWYGPRPRQGSLRGSSRLRARHRRVPQRPTPSPRERSRSVLHRPPAQGTVHPARRGAMSPAHPRLDPRPRRVPRSRRFLPPAHPRRGLPNPPVRAGGIRFGRATRRSHGGRGQRGQPS
jgi:hypothetical protein